MQSCSDNDKDDVPNREKVAVLLMSQANDWRKAVKYHAEKSLEERALPHILQVAEDTQTQMAQMRAAADAGHTVMVIFPEGVNATNQEEYGKLIDELAAKGIKIILSETPIGNNYTAMVYYNNGNVGKQAARAVHDVLDVTVLPASYLFNITAEMAISDDRNKGYTNKMYTGIDAPVHTFDIQNFTRDSGKDGAQQIATYMASIPAETSVIYAQDDEIALGILKYIEDNSTDNPLAANVKAIVGCGGSQEFFLRIKGQQADDSPVLATTLYAPKVLMSNCIAIAAKLLDGESVEKNHLITSDIVTKTNVDEYIDAESPY